MEDSRPKRRKNKYNSYTLHKENGNYYISFSDVNGRKQTVQVNETIFTQFDEFERDDISEMNEYDRHIEHLTLSEDRLIKRNISLNKSLEDSFDISQEIEMLHMAINELLEVQKRRLKKYYFDEMSFKEIAAEEGCNYQCVQRSVYRATEKIKNFLKSL